jgi:hypothetical protein
VDWESDKMWTRTFEPKNKLVGCAIEKDEDSDDVNEIGVANCLININGLEGLED